MEAQLARKPLTPAERAEPPATVCVTGAAGYIASTVVCRLLAAGHTVHATYRQGDDPSTLAALRALPSAEERLRFFQADLLRQGSFDAALAGCKYVVHTAAVVNLGCPAAEAFTRCVNPAVRGALNVLGAASRAGSVRRVVMTSSIAAVLGGLHHDDPNHVATEEDWNISATPDMPYVLSKTLSEWEAWAIASQQDRWDLVTICPANVLGPPLAAIRGSEAIEVVRRLLDGSVYPFAPPIGMPVVDVADVAAAHCLAMVLPGARGRYILCERTCLLTDITATLRRFFPAHWVPNITPPFWLMSLLMLCKPVGMSYPLLKAFWRRKPQLSSAKALRELQGLGPFIPMERSMQDAGETLIRLGLVPAKGSTPAATAAGPKEE